MPAALKPDEVSKRLSKLDGWTQQNNEIRRTFGFKNYYETMAFVNAVAYLAHRADHHPDMEVGYNKLTIRYSTHSAGGITENDFAAAAGVDALAKQ
jgi:4a-hydroxytetrahydrobiopterin dehydratase